MESKTENDPKHAKTGKHSIAEKHLITGKSTRTGQHSIAGKIVGNHSITEKHSKLGKISRLLKKKPVAKKLNEWIVTDDAMFVAVYCKKTLHESIEVDDAEFIAAIVEHAINTNRLDQLSEAMDKAQSGEMKKKM